MPARRRGQEARREQRRVSRLPAQWQPSEDQVWEEHQEWERARRSSPPLPPRRKVFDIRPVIAAVMADFARWEAEREQS